MQPAGGIQRTDRCSPTGLKSGLSVGIPLFKGVARPEVVPLYPPSEYGAILSSDSRQVFAKIGIILRQAETSDRPESGPDRQKFIQGIIRSNGQTDFYHLIILRSGGHFKRPLRLHKPGLSQGRQGRTATVRRGF